MPGTDDAAIMRENTLYDTMAVRNGCSQDQDAYSRAERRTVAHVSVLHTERVAQY